MNAYPPARAFTVRPFMSAWKNAVRDSIVADAKMYAANHERFRDDLELALRLYGKADDMPDDALIDRLNRRLERVKTAGRNRHYSYSSCEHQGLARWAQVIAEMKRCPRGQALVDHGEDE